jgi:putative spermidine/putrescine transport system permease protein
LADTTAPPATLTTADGRPLKASLARAEARSRRRAFLLVLPLLALRPRDLRRADRADALALGPQRPSAQHAEPHRLVRGDGPRHRTRRGGFAALAADLKLARAARTAGEVATRVNYEIPGSRSLFTATARGADDLAPPYREALSTRTAGWGDPALWQAMRGASSAYTANFYLAAIDRMRDPRATSCRCRRNGASTSSSSSAPSSCRRSSRR